MAGAIRTHNTFNMGEKLQTIWERKWPNHRTVMTPNPDVYDGDRKADALQDIAKLTGRGYTAVTGLKDGELAQLTRRTDMILMQCTNEQWQANLSYEAELNTRDRKSEELRIIEGPESF
jgi:hypothetical protein